MSTPGDFRDTYITTVYHAIGVAFTLSSEGTGYRLFDGRPFGLVTAANPGSGNCPAFENAARNAALEAELRRHGLEFGPGSGGDPDGPWREDGFVIWDASVGTVLELGRRFGQNAVLYGEGSRVWLGWCDSSDLEPFWPRPEPPG